MGGDARNKEMKFVKNDDFQRAPSRYAARGDYGFSIEYKKPRAEYVVESYEDKQREKLVKEFFDGFERVNAPDLEGLLERINDQIDPIAIADREAQKKAALRDREEEERKEREEELRKLQEELRKAREEAERVKREAQEQAQLEKTRAEQLQREVQEYAPKEKEEQARIAAAKQKAEEQKRQVEEERKKREKRNNYPTLEDYNREEFEIDGTILVNYMGEGGEVKIPDGVTEIEGRSKIVVV